MIHTVFELRRQISSYFDCSTRKSPVQILNKIKTNKFNYINKHKSLCQH